MDILTLDKAWSSFKGIKKANPESKITFLGLLKTIHKFDFDTIIPLSDESAYGMIRVRLKADEEENKIVMLERRKVVEAWYELNNHPHFTENKELYFRNPRYLIDPVMVDDTGKRNPDEDKNIHLHYWVEVLFPYLTDTQYTADVLPYGADIRVPKIEYSYDSSFDCSGKTYEEAVLNLHKLFIEKFGKID